MRTIVIFSFNLSRFDIKIDSEVESKEDVGSSSNKIFGSRSMARAMVILCACPLERVVPPYPKTV